MGEFEKRIKERIEWEKQHTVCGFGHTFSVPIGELREWVGEAKKEFPNPNDYIVEVDKNTFQVKMLEFFTKYMIVKNKWFGSDKE